MAPTQPIEAASVGTLVEATSFAVMYTLPSEAKSIPSNQDYSAAAAVVQAYLRNFFIKYYDSKKKTTLFSVAVTALGNTASGQAGTGFDLTATFSETSSKIPSKADLDALVKEALSVPIVDNLVELLNNMVASNPLASVESAAYSTMTVSSEDDQESKTEANTVLIPVIGALAGAFALCVAGFGAATIMRRRRMIQNEGSFSKAHMVAGDKTTDNSSAWVDEQSDASQASFENFVRASIQGFDASSSESDQSVRNDP